MENINGKPTLPPPRKYVSIFRINGEPILPPLMTAEKRRQMQELKEKALLVEQRRGELNNQKLGKIVEYNENIKRHVGLQPSLSNMSKGSQDNDECRLKETTDLLKSLLQTQLEENKSKEIKNQEKLHNLQKSVTLIYDNSTNQVVKVPNQDEKNLDDNHQKQPQNMENFQNKNRTHILLAGSKIKGVAAIPAICLNPPTPLTVEKNLFDSLSGAESSESAITSENPNQSLDLSHELSSDESFNSMITHSDKKPFRIADNSSKNIERKTLAPERNVCAKIQQFEAISSDTNTPQTSPEKVYKNRNLCLRSLSGTMNRSATSPSIKLSSSNRSSSSRSQSLIQDSDNSPESNLVRSSSFTLERPSKALIDHMQQQKIISGTKVGVKPSSNINRNLARKPTSTPLRAHRDTVESKAKKVQKMEFKTSNPRIQPKRIQSKLSHAAAASMSPYNTSHPIQHTSYACKTKRSASHTSSQVLHKSISPQMRKSNSASTCLTQNNVSKPKLASSLSSTVSCSSNRKPETYSEKENNIKRKQLAIKLLAEQKEEHRKLQHAFELQQRILIEQLRREMEDSHTEPSNNLHNSLSATSISQQRQFPEQQRLPPRQYNHNHSSQKSKSSSQCQSPTPFSSNSSFIAYNNNHTPNEITHQNLSFGSNFAQSVKAIALNNSHLSLMDQSNANTSLDISMLSMQTTPATPCIQNNSAKNTTVTKTTPSFCRRLFTTEVNGVLNPNSKMNTAGSTVSNTPMESRNQTHLLNHDSNRRSFELHEVAATKINAFARGFLVRRLFKTEQIQLIVQTIRDTLVFVLNLHMETIEYPVESQTAANIKLKARLLKQLSAACRSLHWIFFQSSIKERMEIIARDRQRIQNKIMAMNRKSSTERFLK